MKIKIIIPALLFVTISCKAQKGDKQTHPNFYAGIGLGLDYGGIGFKAEFLPVKSIGIFAGAGANLDKVGLNGGLSWKVLPDKKATPVVMAMYGYNAVIKIKGYGHLTHTYYGSSIGAGYEIKTKKNYNKWSFAIIIPFRSKEFEDRYNELQGLGFEFSPGKTPVLFSIGFNLNSSNKK